ncbi:MAG: hypothetical protein HY697_01325 [Deltaproteobacteria bacterium]|nr:hypothetical protein [Deltaproteobacteria bacterium]
MKRREFLISLVLGFLGLRGTAQANKPLVTIQIPERAAKGSEITVRLTVEHLRNNPDHHTEWLYLKVNGKEMARWDFTGNKLPPGATFTEQVKYRVGDQNALLAEASCNIHGSRGPVAVNIAGAAARSSDRLAKGERRAA